MDQVRAAVLALLVAGCASTGSSPSRDLAGSGGGDGGGSHDLAGTKLDFAGMAGGDLTMPPPGDMAPPADLTPSGLPGGTNCQQDADCASKLCKPVLPGGSNVCVEPCKSQNDCAFILNAFCEAITPGSPDGWCIPHSPTHCSACTKDADCGALSERCLQAPGDIAKACHIDCALSGAAACPPDYDCANVPDGNVMRKLCVPKLGVCLDAIGGYCDRVALPQPCSRTNQAGTCTGQRVCLMLQKRFDKCDAMAPQYKMSCNDLDPAGCMLQFAPNVATTVQNCGTCGKSCACINSGNSDPSCANGMCGLACRGENYDVNNSTNDCCETLHAMLSHASGNPTSTGKQFGCGDGGSNPNISGTLHSDSRTHANPAVVNFNGATGSAPDYQSVFATGGLCVDDIDITLQTNGGTGGCYKLWIITNKLTLTATTNGQGAARITSGSGSYSDGTTITFGVEKVCNLPTQEAAGYTITGHL
jgi:hypothetical protein